MNVIRTARIETVLGELVKPIRDGKTWNGLAQ